MYLFLQENIVCDTKTVISQKYTQNIFSCKNKY